MRAVELDDLESRLERAARGVREGRNNILNSSDLERDRRLLAVVERDRARREDRASIRPPATLSGLPPFHGDAVLALRPACASWMPGTEPCARMNAVTRASGSMCSSFQMPRSSGEMRPSGSTAVASVKTSAAPPTAREPRWTRCQSSAKPSTLEYWHIGETTIRFFSVMPRSVSGAEEGSGHGDERWARRAPFPVSATRHSHYRLRMDAFGYLSVLLSIIVGLGMTQLLAAGGRLIRHRSAVRFYWPPILWAALIVVIFVQMWWTMSGCAPSAHVDFVDFLVVLLQSVMLYMMAAVVLPEDVGTKVWTCASTIRRISRGCSASCSATIVVSALKELTLPAVSRRDRESRLPCFFAAVCVSGIVVKRQRYHEFLAMLERRCHGCVHRDAVRTAAVRRATRRARA